MSSPSSSTPTSYDFLISYAPADRAWAEWIAYILEENGYKVFLEAWDIQAGQNIILMKNQALIEAKQVIILVSPDYMSSPNLIAEWTSAFHRDPSGEKRALIPIIVRECSITGLLGPRIPITLINLNEEQAEETLLNGIRPEERRKPTAAPLFPTTLPKKGKGKSQQFQSIQETPFPPDYAPITRPIQAFILCSKDSHDQALLQNFLSALSPLQTKGVLQTYHANTILAGSHRMNTLTELVKQADIVLPLLSSDFFSDPECSTLSQLAFTTRQPHTAHILPILLRSCMWEFSDYESLTILPLDGIALGSSHNLDDALTSIVREIKRSIDALVLKRLS